MRKKFVSAAIALIGLFTFVVLGSSPDFVDRMVEVLQQDPITKIFSPVHQAEDVLIKNGKSKRVSKKYYSTATERPDKVLWYVVFDFTRKIQKKAAEFNQQGKNGNLYGDYFIRQGQLSAENDLIVKQLAGQFGDKIDPLQQRAKKIIEDAKAEYAKKASNDAQSFPEPSVELKEIQRQKDEITFQYRDMVRAAFGEAAFDRFLEFLKNEFSEGAKSGKVVTPANPQGFFYDAYSWIIWDDDEPPLITGFSELYFFFFEGPPYYDPSLDSYFVNLTTSSLLDFGFDTGYRDIFPAQYFHPTFFSIRGNQYCTLTDHYGVLYDGPFPVDTIYLDSTGVCHIVGPTPPTPTPTPTPNVTSVTFSQVQASTEPISPNPVVVPHNPGIGQRIFPDDDVAQDPVDRWIVRVTATLSQPIPNVLVYFRNFDLDDPATDPTIDPNGNLGNDNNGMPMAGQLLFANGCGASGASVFCPTNSSGVATIDFVVTRQPGDNFAIAAGVIPAQVNAVNINGIELTNGSGQVVPTNCTTELVCRSQMLTVWRRLHIEVDSMGNSIENRQLGRIASTTRIRAGQTVTVPVTASDGTPANLEPNRFEGGRLVVNFRSFDVTCNPMCNTATSVTVTATGSLATLFANTPFELYDDDDFNDNNGPPPDGDGFLDGDTGENILAPNELLPNGMPLRGLDLLTASSDDVNANVFAAAYVRPVYDFVDPRDDCLFQANTESDDAVDLRPLFTPCWDSSGTNTDSDFWSVMIFGAYQHTTDSDGDPSTDGLTLGIVDEITGVTGPDMEGSGALIFMEAHRPREFPGYNPAPTSLNSMAVTVAHEVGHLFSCVHGDGGLVGTDPLTGTPVTNQLSPTMIFKIRDLMHP